MSNAFICTPTLARYRIDRMTSDSGQSSLESRPLHTKLKLSMWSEKRCYQIYMYSIIFPIISSLIIVLRDLNIKNWTEIQFYTESSCRLLLPFTYTIFSAKVYRLLTKSWRETGWESSSFIHFLVMFSTFARLLWKIRGFYDDLVHKENVHVCVSYSTMYVYGRIA